MINVYSQNRRSFLKVGSLALGGLTLEHLFKAKSIASESVLKDKSIIFLFMHGGPSQFETFDPKPNAPAEIRGATGSIQTSIPGVEFGSTFSKLAPLADRMSIVRSFRTGDGNHDIKPIVSKESANANLGTLYSRVAGTTDVVSGMPLNAALFPRAVRPESMPAITQFGDFTSTGTFSSSLAPFAPGAGGDLQSDMTLNLPLQRFEDRKQLLKQIDYLKGAAEREVSYQAHSEIRQQAMTTILGGLADAFDLSKEDPQTIERYDTSPISRADNIDKKWNNYERYVDNGQTLGKLLLMARRLCERGTRFVTVTTNFVWDMHADKNNADVITGMRYVGLPFDHAVSAFLEDVNERGLSDDILLVCCGEMGRTPRINKNGGRDHWGNLAPLMLAGGGLNMGQVIGQSTRNGGEPDTEPITNRHLISTIFNQLFRGDQLRLIPSAPREILQATNDWAQIPGLS